MAYCTQADVETRIGLVDLTDLSDYDDDGTPDATVVAEAISSGEAIIDSYLGTKFQVPVTPVPDVLKTRAVNLTVYYLRLGRDSVTEDVRAQYKDDIAWLQDVVGGRVTLGIAELPAEAGGAPSVKYDVSDRLFGRGSRQP